MKTFKELAATFYTVTVKKRYYHGVVLFLFAESDITEQQAEQTIERYTCKCL